MFLTYTQQRTHAFKPTTHTSLIYLLHTIKCSLQILLLTTHNLNGLCYAFGTNMLNRNDCSFSMMLLMKTEEFSFFCKIVILVTTTVSCELNVWLSSYYHHSIIYTVRLKYFLKIIWNQAKNAMFTLEYLPIKFHS